MDRVKTILTCEWRAYWRRFSRAGLRAGNQGIILILSLLIAFKFLQLLLTASTNVARGNPKLLIQLLGAVFLVWLFPVASTARETLSSRKWFYLPLSLKERFMVRSLSLLIPPSSWLVVAGSIAICYPLAHARNPVAGIAAGLLFIAIAWLTGLTIAHLLNYGAWRKFLWASAFGILAVATVYVIRGGAFADVLSSFSPMTLVVSAAMDDVEIAGSSGQSWFGPLVSLATLATMATVTGVVALWSFKKSLSTHDGPSGKAAVFSFAFLPGRLGGLIEKDFKYFRRLLDIYLGVATAMLCCLYLIVAEERSTGVFWSFIVVVFFCNGTLAFNSFGLDNRSGVDRYALLPLSGRAILLSKNLAYLIVATMQVLPILVLAGWRLGILASVLGLVQAGALAGAYLTWGNWMSVSHPLKMQFFRFANSGAALVDSMGGIIFGSAPGVLLIYLWQRQDAAAAAGTMLIVLLTGVLYFVSVTRFGGRLERQRERIAEAL